MLSLSLKNIMLKIKEINSQKIWDGFVIKQPLYTFFHSWGWGEFNKSMGDQIWRWGIYNHQKLVGVALIIKIRAKRGNFLFCPHGPIFQQFKPSYWDFFLKSIKQFGMDQKVSFIRISPVDLKEDKLLVIFKRNSLIDAPIHMSAESSWVLNLKEKSEEQILGEMRKTTRYEIRRAQKLGYQIIKTKDPKDLKHFLKIYHTTADRENFVPFSDEYLTQEFTTFATQSQAVLFLEKHGSKFVAGLMVIYFGKGAFYHQGATLHLPKESVSYLAQWEAIKEAIKRGCYFYNFWGVAPTDNPKHPWYGLSLFKKGFGGQRVDFIHAQDFPLKPLNYLPTYLFERLRRIRRRL